MILNKVRNSEDEIQDFVSQIKERRMSDLFANFKASFNVIEERNRGKMLTQIKLICKKLAKGKNLETILDELEADDEIAEKEISEIVNVAQNYAPEYDEEKIYDELEKAKKAD
jgi:hypothetical protein